MQIQQGWKYGQDDVMLAFDPFSWCTREQKDSNARDAEVCVLSDDRQKRKRRGSLASGNVRDNAVVRAGNGRLRDNAVPRHRQATCLMLITMPSQNMCRTCFVLCGVFSIKSTCPHVYVGSEKCSLRLVPNISCARLVFFTNVNMPGTVAQTNNSRQETPTFTQLHRFRPTSRDES